MSHLSRVAYVQTLTDVLPHKFLWRLSNGKYLEYNVLQDSDDNPFACLIVSLFVISCSATCDTFIRVQSKDV